MVEMGEAHRSLQKSAEGETCGPPAPPCVYAPLHAELPEGLCDMKPTAPKPHPRNPNRMGSADKERLKKALSGYGDHGGIVINRRPGLLVGGHQRVEVLASGKLNVKDLAVPEAGGTVARGWLVHEGVQYSVRVVDWTEKKAQAAMIAANRFARVGRDEFSALADLLQELDTGEFDMDLTGYDAATLELMATAGADKPSGGALQVSDGVALQGNERVVVVAFEDDSSAAWFREYLTDLRNKHGTESGGAALMKELRS